MIYTIIEGVKADVAEKIITADKGDENVGVLEIGAHDVGELALQNLTTVASDDRRRRQTRLETAASLRCSIRCQIGLPS